MNQSITEEVAVEEEEFQSAGITNYYPSSYVDQKTH